MTEAKVLDFNELPSPDEVERQVNLMDSDMLLSHILRWREFCAEAGEQNLDQQTRAAMLMLRRLRSMRERKTPKSPAKAKKAGPAPLADLGDLMA